ncbi:hypothetical protein [Jannaschia sp. W003]|uniref:hypothetical protein n=1 Tax=Jannaschia sp. W003 TaxID=2867012 RepID=UPI0021A8B880|nr:hypothetical protein [Jannaschia sp. W003]UWQ20421.1 hypothetical protein K3554_10485 [Jannaschia sp. W003]
MSAPKTNVEKQERLHSGPLMIMAACLAFVAVILVAYFVFIVDDVEDGATEVEGVVAPAVTE